MKAKIAVYWDVQNGKTSSSKIEHFYQGLIQTSDLLISNAYAYWKDEKKSFEQTLSEMGIDMINVLPGNNAVDYRIIQDCKKHILSDPSIKTVVLITGDGDFLSLVQYLKESRVLVILISMNNVAEELKNAVDYAYHINELIPSIKLYKATPKTLYSPAIIPYEEAKKCLIELIKTVKEKGKKATLDVLGRLIKKHPQLSGYKKVSYYKSDGKYYSKFSKFVDAVIQEGIIQDCNGELILV
ncbi:MAG: NYN domain-containing protein [Planktothrix agardhii]|uniref:NYN domain-containing protein n=1 Tax=Planktothrix agardhii TaxID=1160 RepID=UPI003C42E22D